MADLVERLRAHLDGNKLHAFDSLLAEDVEEAVDEIERLRQSRFECITERNNFETELRMLRARIEAAPVGVVEESGWNDDGYDKSGRVYGIPSDLVGASVRLVVEE